MRARTIAILENLNPDDKRVPLSLWQRGQVPAYELASSLRHALRKLLQSRRRNIETNQIETVGDKGQIIPAVAAADVEALSPDQAGISSSCDDVSYECNGRVVLVPTRLVL